MSSIESIIDRQMRRWELERQIDAGEARRDAPAEHFRPVITVSRQRGSRGSYVAEKLAERFSYTLLHRDLINQICASSGLKRRLVEALDERARSRLEEWFSAVIEGKYVDHSDYIRHLADVINSVSMLGGVVVVGRGANFIVGRDRGFNIRVIAPAECRRANLSEYQGLGAADAAREVEVSDRERSEFIRRYFGKDIDDANHYDMVINTAQISMETVINAVSVAALDKFERIRPR